MDKRYQVFVSSTYADLKDERQKVMQALMEMDCIPAGMELFPAADDQQLDFIRRVIDDCDYYVIIIGGRYGSTTAEGISYTEKEFEYAEKIGLKVVAFIHEDPNSIALNKSELDSALRQRLELFRQRVASNRLVKFWKTAEELPGLVVLSLSKTIKTYPAVGWVRSSSVASADLLLEINELRKQNQDLSQKLESYGRESAFDTNELADLDATIQIHGEMRVRSLRGQTPSTKSWEVTVSWRELFSLIAPYLLDHPSELTVKGTLARVVADHGKLGGYSRTINDQEFKTISIQLKALGLVKIDCLRSTQGGMTLFWSLTTKGEAQMIHERVVKK